MQSGAAGSTLTEEQVTRPRAFPAPAGERLVPRIAALPGAERPDRRREGGRGVLQRRGQVRDLPHGDRRNLAGIGAPLRADRSAAAVPVPRRRARRARWRGGPASPASAVKVTVTPAAGEAVTGVLLQMDDFNVSLRDAVGRLPDVQARPWREGRERRSARGASRAARHIDRQEHARRRRLPGDLEMKRLALLVCGIAVCAGGRWSAAQTGLRSGKAAERRAPTRGRATTATTPAGASAR